MSETPAPAPTPPATKEPDKPESPAQVDTDWKAESRKWEQRAKENRALADELLPLKDQMTALAQVFGVKPESGDGDIVGTLQVQIAAMQHQALVDRVARTHGITDPEALDILSTAKDEQAMAKRAEWLNATKAPPTPKPDASQGAKGDPNKPDPGPGVARLAAAFEDEFDK